MASSSSSSVPVTSPRRNYYDVFVSFRGKDTRYNFVDHLFAALQRKGLFAFRDDTKLKKGESIAPELLRAINDSHIFVVIFSKNYASSTWCLRELECILNCVQLSGKRVLPVFYDVDPSEVRYQKGSYGEAFLKHEQRFQRDSEMLQRWREALTQVANISGWDIRDKPQYAEIEMIAEEIINIFSYKFLSLPKDLVGMDSPIEELEKYLLMDSVDGVRVVGISGMGGIGKTTLATVLYNKISSQFPVCCHIDDLSKIFRHDGLIGVQKQILHQTLGEELLQTCNLYKTSNLIQSRLRCIKSLIILDNVDQVEQLEKLAVSREWLGAGSRIIIVSRDEHVLKEYGVDIVYKVPLLNETDSLQLFSQKAFKIDHVMSGYDTLTFDILWYANGLPLAIKVLGSFLFGRDINEWKSALARLRESPNKDIMDVLRLSFEALEKLEKEIFLDIACFFNRHEEDYVKNILNCCGFHADIGFRVLIDKSLLSISEDNIKMHSLLQVLGRKIVQENSSRESRRWSRVWLHEQLHNVMLENVEKKVEAICFQRDRDERQMKISVMAEALSKMSHLRFLILKNVIVSGNLSCLSSQLRYMEWKNYPYKYLPSSFQPNQLAELILRKSNVKQLWKDKKCLPNLRILDLSYSKNLRKTPDFEEIPNVERISFEGCVKLVQIDPSIEVLRKLFFLNLKDCKNLVSMPNNIFGLSSLECLILSGCPKVFKNPKHLNIRENSSHSQSTTSSILKWGTFRFHSLYSDAHKYFASFLLPSFLNLSSLLKLDISFCGLRQIPDEIGCLRWLERLDLGGNNFVTLPSLRELSRLAYLNLQHCKLLESLPQLPFPTAIEHDLHKYKYWRTIGLVIFNCPNLGERESYSSMAFSWMIQLIQERQQYSTAFFDVINIVIPKSQIPSWFNNQSVSDSIPIELSPFLHYNDDNIIGISCCAVFSISPIDPTVTIYGNRCINKYEIELSFSNKSTCYGWCELFTCIPIILERDLIAVKSDHMWLIHFTRDSFFDILKRIDVTLNHLDDFCMKVVSMNCKGLHVKVQSCGYRWVNKQDLQLKHGCGNFVDRKCKILAIEDEAEPQSSSDYITPKLV